jgi:hypothetical protein
MKRLVACLFLCGCDDPKAASAADANAEAAPPAAPATRTGEGCARAGTLDGVETDPSCVLAKVSDDVMKDFGRRLTLRLEVEPETVIAGSMAVLRLTITNVASSETLVAFDAYPRGTSPRPDWSRLAGVPDVKGEQPDLPRLQLVVSTADTHDRPVDAVPLVANANNALAASSGPRILGVRLRPGAKLTSAASWHALRIPAPAPIFKDDAGHRFVPKTTAVSLYPGDYVISVDVPLHGLAPAERTVTARVHVEKATKPDQ